MSNNTAETVAKVTMGAVQELARQGGTNAGTPHGAAAQVGAYAVQGVAAAAPVVAAGASTVVTTAMAAATVLAPVAVVLGAGYAAYKIYKAVAE